MRKIALNNCFVAPLLAGPITGVEPENRPDELQSALAGTGVCVWPNLTRMKDGTIPGVLHSHDGYHMGSTVWTPPTSSK